MATEASPAARTNRLGWYGRLQTQERRTFWAAFGGNALDNLDVSLFTFLIPTLIAAWGMSHGQAGLIASSALLSGAVGGVVTGALADRFGRVRVLQLTILWFSFFTFLCGFAQSPEQMLIARTLQGLGFGGELAVGAVLVGEAVRPEYRGRIMGGVASGYAVGAMGASALFALSYALLPPEVAWRWALWAGILPALLVLYIRRAVKEPDVYLSAKRAPLSKSVGALFAPDLLGRTVLGTLLVAGAAGAQVVLAIWLPAWLHGERGLSVSNTSFYAILNSIGAFVGCLCGGYILDKVGRRNTFRIFASISIVGILGYLLLPLPGPILMGMGILVGLSMVVTGVGMTPVLTELFPTSVRGSGLGFCYSVGRAMGAISPAIVGWAADMAPLGAAIAAGVVAHLILVIVVATLLPETAGRALGDG
jgi:MFS family permease